MLLIELLDRQEKRMDELDTIYWTHALSQSSQQGASLLFTCPTPTAVSAAMYSDGYFLVVAAVCYVISTR